MLCFSAPCPNIRNSSSALLDQINRVYRLDMVDKLVLELHSNILVKTRRNLITVTL